MLHKANMTESGGIYLNRAVKRGSVAFTIETRLTAPVAFTIKIAHEREKRQNDMGKRFSILYIKWNTKVNSQSQRVNLKWH